MVDEGQKVRKKQPLYYHDPYNAVILSDITGFVKFVDLIDKFTMEQITDDQTGHVQKVVIEPKDKGLSPSIVIENADGKEDRLIFLRRLSFLWKKGQKIPAGTILATLLNKHRRPVISPVVFQELPNCSKREIHRILQ